MMNCLRKQWYDFGLFVGILLLFFLFFLKVYLSDYDLLMYLSLVSLLLHQAEEYRLVGTFPGFINKKIFNSNLPDRFPLNTNTSFIVNVFVGWSLYLLAAIIGQKALFLGLATILVSFGNLIAHTFLFNIKAKTFFNAGLVSSWLFFAPCIYCFFYLVLKNDMASTSDFIIGSILGISINIFGVFKPIVWLQNKETAYIFEQRQLLKEDRKK
jgi:hypothetical protein